ATRSYHDLAIRANAIAAMLQTKAKPGDRVLMVYQPGLAFIAAYFGCLYAGMVAVPVIPPLDKGTSEKLQLLIQDATPAVCLATTEIVSKLRGASWGRWVPGVLAFGALKQAKTVGDFEFDKLPWVTTDKLSTDFAKKWQRPAIDENTLAFLQYTSGSTGQPKGVMVSHGNLLHNLYLTQKGMRLSDKSHGVFWLPPYHDMGLIGGILQAVYSRYPCVLLSPFSFLKKPFLWLKSISDHHATVSGGPNFAYELCVAKIKPEERAKLNLSSWQVAFSGAEPIRAATLEKFSDVFAECGFNPKFFYPCYGLAEATLMVSGAMQGQGVQIDQHKHVSSGHIDQTVKVEIVDPDTRELKSEGEIGEVWTASKSVAQGYWNKPEETEATFRAYLANGAGPFLRTGDLGFLRDGELYISGRIKDLIIVNGRNYYPQDIEEVAEQTDPIIRKGCCAAFSIEQNDQEQVVVVIETRSTPDAAKADKVFAECRAAASSRIGIHIYAILLVLPRILQKTTSGKIMRRAARDAYLNDELKPHYISIKEPPVIKDLQIEAYSKEAIAAALIELLQQIYEADADISDTEFGALGLTSPQIAPLVQQLNQWLGLTLSPTIFWEHPTINKLAAHLAAQRQDIARKPQALQSVPVFAASSTFTPLAVLGISCRFPGGSNTPEKYWDLLSNGCDGITEVPARSWDSSALAGKISSKYGGFLNDIDQFDAGFFGVSPKEAEVLDPQHRILLELVWEALERANIDPTSLNGSRTGVFVGISTADYGQLLQKYLTEDEVSAYVGSGNALSAAAGRVANFLGLSGPALVIDTACSSSLVAVDAAANYLQTGKIDMAIVAGVNLILASAASISFSKANMLAVDGKCKTFAANADGYTRSEGCGVLVFKRHAEVTDEAVLAIIKGIATNQDGATNGLTVPNPDAQEKVIRAALQVADLAPKDIGYIEAHGTGTKLGDPIEVGALSQVFEGLSIPVGSAKTQIGHMEAAAGMGGLFKVILALANGQIPRNLHLTELNPLINTTLQFPTQNMPWQRNEERKRYAGVSSFGFTGTNAHIIIEEAPARVSPELSEVQLERPCHLLTLSAKTEAALAAQVQFYQKYLAANPTADLADIAYTANTGRAHFKHRLAVVAIDANELHAKLRDHVYVKNVVGGKPKIAFLFTGQASQYFNMGRELYETQPFFRKTLEQCADCLPSPHLDIPLLELLFNPKHQEQLNQTKYTQLALFALEYSLAKLWQSWGIEPDYVMGHSVGEYVAATIAGILSLEDGIKLIATRANLMQRLPEGGGMLVVTASLEQVQKLIQGLKISIAAINSPEQIVISGELARLKEFSYALTTEGIKHEFLNVSHAFHSFLMRPMLEEFGQIAKSITYNKSTCGFISNVTGAVLAEINAEYWQRHILAPVNFMGGIQSLNSLGCNAYLEIGPDPVLSVLGRGCISDYRLHWLPSLHKNHPEWLVILSSLSHLYAKGAKVDWKGFDSPYSRQKLMLPTYPFQRQRYWSPVLDRRHVSEDKLQDWFYKESWNRVETGLLSSNPMANYLPMMTHLVENLQAKLASAGDVLTKEPRLLLILDKLSYYYILQAFYKFGWQPQPGQEITSTEMQQLGAVQSKHQKLLLQCFNILVAEGALKELDSSWSVERTPQALELLQDNIAVLLQQLAIDHPDSKIEIGLLSRCGERLAAVMQGAEDPLPLLFPEEHSVGAEINAGRLYQESPFAKIFNNLVQEVFSAALRQVNSTKIVKILEIGAGTGGTTVHVLSVLGELGIKVEYTYTDISAGFFPAAKRKFSDFGTIDYQILNIEEDPKNQGFAPHQYDIILAANVLHATVDINQTLRNTRHLLAPNGMLVLLEGIKPARWLDLTFGLLDGWWRFADNERCGNPLLSGKKWRQLLEQANFAETYVLAAEDDKSNTTSQQGVIIARADSTKPLYIYNPVNIKIDNKPCWLIFTDADNFGEDLYQQLQQVGEVSLKINTGTTYQQIDAATYEINPGQKEDFARLFQEIKAQQKKVKGILYLWGLSNQAELKILLNEKHKENLSAIATYQQRACGGLLHLLQRCLTANIKPPLWVITKGCHVINQQATTNPMQATLWGMSKTIAREYSELRCSCIDLDPSERNQEIVASSLLRELWLQDREAQIAIRNQAKYVTRLERAKITSAGSSIDFQVGTYLITGGLGGLGLEVTDWLIKQGVKHIALLSRSQPSASIQERIRVMETAGAKIIVLQVDVANKDELQSALTDLEHTSPSLKGVIHAAGVLADATLLNQSWEKYQQVFGAKVYGAWNLHVLTRKYQLDCFIMFSSIAALFGPGGQSNHAAANAYLDALAHYRHNQGLPGLSINWGIWSEIGAAAKKGADKHYMGLGMISPEQGIRALARVLKSSGQQQVVISPIDWKVYEQSCQQEDPWLRNIVMEIETTVEPKPMLSSENSHASLTDTLLQADASAYPKIIQKYLEEQLKQILGVPANTIIEKDRNFMELGVDSLMAMEFKNKLQAELGGTFSPSLLFDYPNLDALTAYLSELSSEQAGLSLADAQPGKEVADDNIPASFGQKTFYFLNDALNVKHVYHVTKVFELEGRLDEFVLGSALATIIQRHEILRTCFRMIESELIQIVLPHITFNLKRGEYADIERIIQEPFDFSIAPLFRVALIEHSKAKYSLVVVTHHAIFDGLSTRNFMDELSNLYNAYMCGLPVSLPKLSSQYRDFAIEQKRKSVANAYSKQLDFWRGYLASAPLCINLPTDRARTKTQIDFQKRKYVFTIPTVLTGLINDIVLSHSKTRSLYRVLLAAYYILLYRYTGDQDLVVGGATANRNEDRFKDLIGFFVNTVVNRVKIDPNVGFVELLQQVEEKVSKVLANSEVPYEMVVDSLSIPRDPSYQPLFQTVFVLHDTRYSELTSFKLEGLSVEENAEFHNPGGMFDLAFMLTQRDKTLHCEIEYNCDLFNEDTIFRMSRNFAQLLESIVANPSGHISRLQLLAKEECRQLIEWNQTEREYQQDKTIQQIFEEQVKRNPGKIAVVFEGVEYSYERLNREANRLAHFLLAQKEMHPGALVALYMGRSPKLIVAVLAILKAGGAYVPLDFDPNTPNTPKERLGDILKDCKAAIVLTNGTSVSFAGYEKGGCIDIDEKKQDIDKMLDLNPSIAVSPSSVAYVIYTSGTTGKPKGVMVGHAGVINLAEDHAERFLSSERDERILQFANIYFDGSIFEIFICLLNLATLVMLADNIRMDPSKLRQFMIDNRV
ncbi:MAG: SDR family NAD(P)-dependent oxidoreductase, partial [Gammaproteobacteria bacterium]|nr:SDR family NAD(P)-dependent oxidoreductase [Gammaproteobacteria bacterium]